MGQADDHASMNNIPTRRETLIRWLSPLCDWIALNIDDAAKGSPGAARGGGVLRDCYGNFIKAFSANFGVCSAYRAELLALEIGLHMVATKGISKLVVQMDNKACIEALQRVRGGLHLNFLSQEYQGGITHRGGGYEPRTRVTTTGMKLSSTEL
uniref:RNase H type-1 domain-containing protein n=1 Tax=Chenopodium quinoa TaxID=63459 RepID=A0A803LJ19_CHEQI